MGLFDIFKKKPRSDAEKEGDPNGLWIYVRCSRCGTPVAVRVDRRNDLSRDFDAGGFVLHKEIMDSKCFQLIYAQLRYDEHYNVTEQTITNGTFITRAEYEASQPKTEAAE